MGFLLRQLPLLLVMSLLSIASYAQETIVVSGHVKSSENGVPVANASVLVVGGRNGTTTDANGFFSIKVAATASLEFSSVGFDAVTLPVNNSTNLDVTLHATESSLQEVIVVGAVMKKGDLTGAVSSISADKIAQTPTTDINQAIQGKVPGVYVKANASPGADASIQIRGNNSLQYGTGPIYVVDGVIIDGGFNTLNPDDIESVTVLKDASSTAIYGSRGANGVVIVTTKKGKKGEGRITYNGWVGWQSFSKKLKLMNAGQLYNLRIDAFANAYMDANPDADRQTYIDSVLLSNTASGRAFADYEMQTYQEGKSYDWLDQITRAGIEHNHTLTFSGGTDKGNYLVSMNYTGQDGLIKNSDYQRYNGRINLDQQVKSWLKIGTNTMYSRGVQNVADGGVFNTALTANPLLPITTENLPYLKYADIISEDAYNPIVTLNNINKQYYSRLLSSSYISISPIKNLDIRSTFSVDNLDQQQYQYLPINSGQSLRNNDTGFAQQYKSETTNLQWDNTATYNLQSGKNRWNFLAGTSVQKNTTNYNQIQAYNFPGDDFTYKNIGAAVSKLRNTLASNFVTTALLSYIGRVEYSYNDKYFATATLRYDGSSNLAPDHRWSTFPSLALAWDMSREKFMSGVAWLNQLKIRAGYGIAGNQNIPQYGYYSLYNVNYTNGTYNFVPAGNLGNPDIKWERQKQVNLGFDAILLNNRLNATFNWFHINNDDLLWDVSGSAWRFFGYSNEIQNIGEMTNKGWEFDISYAIIKQKDFNWNFNFDISTSKNKVVRLDGGQTAIYNKGGYTGTEIQPTGNFFVGQPVNAIYLLKFKKIAQQSDMATIGNVDYGGRTIHPGDIIPQDINGDGKIDDNDRTVVGTTDPKYFGGFGTDLSYKGFALNAFFTYSQGLKRISGLYNGLVSSAGMSAASVDLNNRWTPENTNTLIPRAVYGESEYTYGNVDLGVQNSSFLRLSTVTLSYTFPPTTVKRMFLDNLKIYVCGTNMLLFTKDKGYDPETGDGYPNSKTVIVGVNIAL